MRKDIQIEMTVAEALLALGPIQDKALESSRLAAISEGDEHEIADLSAKMLGQVATRIVDALYPEPAWGRMTQAERYTKWHAEVCARDAAGCMCSCHDGFRPPVDLRREDLLAEIEFGLV